MVQSTTCRTQPTQHYPPLFAFQDVQAGSGCMSIYTLSSVNIGYKAFLRKAQPWPTFPGKSSTRQRRNTCENSRFYQVAQPTCRQKYWTTVLILTSSSPKYSNPALGHPLHDFCFSKPGRHWLIMHVLNWTCTLCGHLCTYKYSLRPDGRPPTRTHEWTPNR